MKTFLVLILARFVVGLNEVHFSSCSGNWNCTDVGSFRHVSYDCSDSTNKEIFIDLMTLVPEFSQETVYPIRSLSILGCTRLRVNMNYKHSFNLKSLLLSNANELELEGTVSFGFQQPADIFIYNIGYLSTIKKGTFHYRDMEDIIFKDVRIGTIETSAFSNFQALGTFKLFSVVIEKLEMRAIQLSLHSEGSFGISNSQIESADDESFILDGGHASVVNCTFRNAELSSILGDVAVLEFTNNEILRSTKRLDIVAEKMIITNNNWKTMGRAFPVNWRGFLKEKDSDDTAIDFLMHDNTFSNDNEIEEGANGPVDCSLQEDYVEDNVNCSMTLIRSDSCQNTMDYLFLLQCHDKCVKGVCSGTMPVQYSSLYTLASLLYIGCAINYLCHFLLFHLFHRAI